VNKRIARPARSSHFDERIVPLEHAGLDPAGIAPMSFRLALLTPLLVAATMPATARDFGRLAFAPCTLAPEFSASSVEAQCGTLRVPENPAEPAGRQIELAIAWVPTENDEASDPVLMLAGGPGQSARDSYPGIAPAFAEVLRKRHVLLVDQRGTGGSNALVCRDAEGRSAVGEEVDATPEAAAQFARDCLARLQDDADPRFYTTTDAVRDLEAVRVAIGVERLNLVGISYGTRVAQQYLMRHPQRVRSIVLDGVVPNELALGSEHAKNLERALDLQFARCAKVENCRRELGDPRTQFAQLAAELKAAPRQVRYRDPFSGVEKEDALTYGHLAAVVRMYTYAPVVAAMLPLTLHEAAQGRAAPLMAQAQMMMGQLGEQIMHGMQLSVLCSEDAAQLRADPADAVTVLGTEFIDYSLAQCAVWPRGEMPADFHAPIASDAPVLLLSGEFDPVTPPRYGEQVAKGLSRSRHLVLKGQGHNVIGVGCTPKLVARFIDTVDAGALDATCLDRLAYAAPFTGFNGWDP
jgi:pimeloyl-ACP methyl ester carboxylesterase